MNNFLLVTAFAATLVGGCSKSSLETVKNSVSAGAKKMSAPLGSTSASI